MKTTFFKTVLIVTLAIGLFSCRKDKADQPANEIIDAQGLKIQLNWSLTDGSTATTGTNVDFYIYKGVGPSKDFDTVLSGNSSTAFEDKDFLSSQPDGEYTLEIYYNTILKNGKFNLVLKGIGSDRTYSLNDNNFTTISDGSEFDFLKITKAGEKYTITKLNKSTYDSEINDLQGLNIQMNWALTNDTIPLNTDIDFHIYKGVGASKERSAIISAQLSSSFENKDFLSSQPDGDYTLGVDYFYITKNGKFNLILKGKASGTTYSLNDNNFVTTSDEVTFDFIKITKTGTKYTISKLF